MDHKTNINNTRSKITQNVPSAYSRIKPEINKINILGKSQNIWKLSNNILNTPWDR